MARSTIKTVPPKKTRKATSLEQREKQIVGYAMDEAEKRIKSGKASSQLLTHFVKLGSTTNKLDNEIKVLSKDLMKAKTKTLESQEDMTKIVKEAIASFKEYKGGAASE